ncbi:hypothetical protein DYH09_31195 [bacterium CPR1]|nr:hypothetical protein [bacterium CPR1]
MSQHAFLSRILDYAGMFPPAALALEPALERYVSYRGHFMLGGFILAVGRLGDLSAQSLFGQGEWPLVLLGSPLSHPASAQRLAEADVEAIAGELGARLGQVVSLEAVEIAPAPEALAELGQAARAQVPLYEQLSDRLQVFYEVRGTGFEALEGSGAGLKIRAGGVTADSFPTARELAASLAAWGPLSIPLKLTAGLHQPLPHYDPELEVRQHGFLNVFSAAMLARRDHLQAGPLQAILGLDRPEHFRFSPAGLELPGHQLSLQDITTLRQVVKSFGSCSFDDPLQALTAHGFLEAP